MSLLSVNEVLKTSKQNITDLAIAFGYEDKIDEIENQWKNINFLKWTNSSSTVEFWKEVNQYKDAAGENTFSELVSLAFSVITLPHSNAEVERVFSQVNIVKNSLRNRMKTNTLYAILTVRFGLRRVEKCCFSYDIPSSVLRHVGTKVAYTLVKPTEKSERAGEEEEEEEEVDEDEDAYFC